MPQAAGTRNRFFVDFKTVPPTILPATPTAMNDLSSGQSATPSSKNELGKAFAQALSAILKLHRKAGKKLSSRNVHRLRVAIRKCRTVASDAGEIDSSEHWEDLRKLGKELFDPLGHLRDLQVSLQVAKEVLPSEDELFRNLRRDLKEKIKEAKSAAVEAFDSFDRKQWKRWSKDLPDRLAEVLMREDELASIARNKLTSLKALHQRALRSKSPDAWHALRIAYKHFRYAIENFFPAAYQEWGETLGRVQDLLGEVHDLDVLRNRLQAIHTRRIPQAILSRVLAERNHRLDDYREMVRNGDVDFKRWRHALAPVPSNNEG